MYVYMLPLSHSHNSASASGRGSLLGSASSSSEAEAEAESEAETVIPVPTHDGGLEHTAARFLPASTWLRLADEGRIILFPPQYFLLSRLAPFLSPDRKFTKTDPGPTHEELVAQRKKVTEFLKGGVGGVGWGDMCISPLQIGGQKMSDGRVVLGLDRPGLELEKEGQGRRGEGEHVVLVDFTKNGPRRVEVRKRAEVLAEGRERVEKL